MLGKRTRRRLVVTMYICISYALHLHTSKEIDASLHRSHSALHRRKIKRTTWEEFNTKVTDVHFRRMFRMTRDCFSMLCNRIIVHVGESNFKSEAYLDAYLRDNSYNDTFTRMHHAHLSTSGGYISGEVKLAIAIRMLAGGSALDLAVIFDVSVSHCKSIFIDVLHNWIIKSNIGNINMKRYLNDEVELDRVSNGFSQRSNGILTGAIGAIDGWLVKIQRPSEKRDLISNPSSFFSRKGFYALNVQIIVNHEKKFCGRHIPTGDHLTIQLVLENQIYIRMC